MLAAVLPIAFQCHFKQRVYLKTMRCSDVALQPAYENLLTIQHCIHSTRAGVFVITRQASVSTSPLAKNASTGLLPGQVLHECTGVPIYRVRIVGNEIFEANVTFHAESIFHADYEVRTQSGTYYAEIIQLYSTFSFCDLPGLNDKPLVALHQWHVQSDEASNCSDGTCPHCPPGSLRGRWIADSDSPFIARFLDQIKHTHVFGDPTSVGSEANETRFKVLDPHILRWQPHASCTIEPTPDVVKEWGARCNALNGPVCFAGDSQMRHLYCMAVSIMDNDFSPVTPMSGQSLKLVPPSNWSRYIGIHYGQPGEVQAPKFENCTRLVLNVGQWPISYMVPGGRPWTAQEYHRSVIETIETIQRGAPHLKGKIAWMSTHPFGLARGLHGSSGQVPKDWRTDPYIIQQNALMQSLSRRELSQLDYVDTFGIIHPLADLSYDSAHYIGTPGYWSTALALHHVCR